MDYTDYSVEDFIKDEYFQKWIIDPDAIVLAFWQKWMENHPEKKKIVKCASDLIRMICNEDNLELHGFDADTLWRKILQKKDKINIDIPNSGFRSKKNKKTGNPRTYSKSQNYHGLNNNGTN